MNTQGWRQVVVAAPPAVRTPADIAALPACAEVVELRLDLLHALQPSEVRAYIDAVTAWGRRVLLTLRSTAEGGQFEGTPEAAAAILSRHADAVWRVDVESGVAPLVVFPNRLQASHAGEIEIALRDMASGVEAKVARRIDDASAWAAFQKAAARAPVGVSWVPFGGLASARTMFTGWGGTSLLFGAADIQSAVVAGQPTLPALLDELRVGEVDPQAVLFGLAGRPPTWSPSPALHNAVFRHEQRNALYVSFPGLDLESVCALPVAGVSVTTPYKAEAFALANERTPAARATGVVNTLVRRGDEWQGLNTDADAFAALVPGAQAGATALVYGAGATARSAVFGLSLRGFAVRVAARRAAAAQQLCDEMDASFAGTVPSRISTDAVLVNTTPAGGSAPLPPWADDFGLQGLLVLDATYRHDTDSDWIHRAQIAGAQCVSGRLLLETQAMGQAVAFGAKAPDPVLRQVLQLAMTPPPTLWLIGPRGVGKSVVGADVARMLGRPFVDLDDEVVRRTGRSIEATVHSDGWETFRAAETDAVRSLEGRRGLVVATGGGLVERPENHRIPQSGCVVWLDAPPSVVLERQQGDRPRVLLPGMANQAGETRKLAQSRGPLYEQWSHARVDATQPLVQVVHDVVHAWVGSLDVAKGAQRT